MRLPRVAAVALVAAGVALSPPAWGASPLEGTWANGSGRLVEIVAVGGGFEIRAAEPWLDPANCEIHPGDVLDRLTPQGGGVYVDRWTFFEGGFPTKGRCRTTTDFELKIRLAVAGSTLEWTCVDKLSSPAFLCATLTWKRPGAPDTTPPSVRAQAASGRRGVAFTLAWYAKDDSGRAGEVVTIRRAGSILRTLNVTVGPRGRDFGRVAITVPASVSAGLSGALTWCVVATDASGNRSARSCARLTIR